MMSRCFSCYIATNFAYDIDKIPCRMACGTSKYVRTAELLSQTNNTDRKHSLCMKYVFHELMELGGYTIPYFH